MIFLMAIESNDDRDKVERLFDKYWKLMYNHAFSIVKERTLSEDVVQDSFIKVVNNLQNIGDEDSIETKNYLMIITKNTAYDAYKKRKRCMERESAIDDLENDALAVFCNYAEVEEKNRVLEVLRGLPDQYRDIFLLRYGNSLSTKQVADTVGLKEDTVRQRLSRGKKIVQERLDEIMGDEKWKV